MKDTLARVRVASGQMRLLDNISQKLSQKVMDSSKDEKYDRWECAVRRPEVLTFEPKAKRTG